MTDAQALAPPAFGSDDERRAFAEIQRRLGPLYARIFPDPAAQRTVVVVPSMSLPREELAKLSGANHYEERLLCMLMLLRLPRANVVYVTSEPIAPSVIDYYLHLLPGVPPNHARRRLTLLSCADASAGILAEKLLARRDLLVRIRAAIPDRSTAHMTCFAATGLERSLAVSLDIPLYACDPDLQFLGTKSGSRGDVSTCRRCMSAWFRALARCARHCGGIGCAQTGTAIAPSRGSEAQRGLLR